MSSLCPSPFSRLLWLWKSRLCSWALLSSGSSEAWPMGDKHKSSRGKWDPNIHAQGFLPVELLRLAEHLSPRWRFPSACLPHSSLPPSTFQSFRPRGGDSASSVLTVGSALFLMLAQPPPLTCFIQSLTESSLIPPSWVVLSMSFQDPSSERPVRSCIFIVSMWGHSPAG